MLIIVAALAVAASSPDAAQPPAADPVVCKRDKSSDVGTHMRPKPICMKKSDWDYVEKNTQQELRSAKDHLSYNPGRSEGHGATPQ